MILRPLYLILSTVLVMMVVLILVARTQAGKITTVVEGSWYVCGATNPVLAPQVTRETLPLVQFHPTAGTIQWTDMCNDHSRQFRTAGTSLTIVNNTQSTKRACIVPSPLHLQELTQFISRFVHGMWYIIDTDLTIVPPLLHLQKSITGSSKFESLVLVQPVETIRTPARDLEGLWAFCNGDICYYVQPMYQYTDLVHCILLGLLEQTSTVSIGGTRVWTVELIVRL